MAYRRLKTEDSHSDQGYQKWDGSSLDSFIPKIVFFLKLITDDTLSTSERLQQFFSHATSTKGFRKHLGIDWLLIDESLDEIAVLRNVHRELGRTVNFFIEKVADCVEWIN